MRMDEEVTRADMTRMNLVEGLEKKRDYRRKIATRIASLKTVKNNANVDKFAKEPTGNCGKVDVWETFTPQLIRATIMKHQNGKRLRH